MKNLIFILLTVLLIATTAQADITTVTPSGDVTVDESGAMTIKISPSLTTPILTGESYPVTSLTPSTSTNPLTINAAATASLELAPTGTQTQTFAFSGNPSSGVRYVNIHVTTAGTGATTLAWPSPGSTFGWIGTAGTAAALTASKEYQYVCEVGVTKTRCKIVQEAY